MARAQRARARGGARTMPRWLRAAMCLAIVQAWTPPPHAPLLFPTLHRVRPRRDAPARSEDVDTHTVLVHGWLLRLRENLAIRAPYVDDCRFYKGRVVDEDESSAAITECGGRLYGLLQVRGEEFVLQPTEVPRDAHVLRRRDITLTYEPTAFNLTDDTVTDLDLNFDEEFRLPYIKPRGDGSEYFHNTPVFSRPISGSYVIK